MASSTVVTLIKMSSQALLTDTSRLSRKSMLNRFRLSKSKSTKLHRGVKKETSEMVNYCLFLALFVTATLWSRLSDAPFQLSSSLEKQFTMTPFLQNDSFHKKVFHDIITVGEIYEFLHGPFYQILYKDITFDSDLSFPHGLLYNQRGFLYGASKIMGLIRIGQVRTEGEECPKGSIPPVLSNLTESLYCFPHYSPSTASFSSFREYKSEKPIGPPFISPIGVTYPPPSHNVYLPNKESPLCNISESINHCHVYQQIKSLEYNKFIDKGTRALFVDMSLYNPSLDGIINVRLFFELTNAGGCLPFLTLGTYRVFTYYTKDDFLRLTIELLVIFIALYQLILELKKIYHLKKHYFRSPGNVTYLFDLLLFPLVFTCRFLAYINIPFVDSIQDDQFIDFRTPCYYAEFADGISSFNCFLTWMKLFKFLSFIPTFAQLTLTIYIASQHVVGFAMMFGIILFGSSQSFLLAFGKNLEEFSTVKKSFYALIRLALGESQFTEMQHINGILGPLFFILFVVLIDFVLLNMFIAIIADAYVESKIEVRKMRKTHLRALAKEIIDHFIHHVLFKTPIFGPMIIIPFYYWLYPEKQNMNEFPMPIPVMMETVEITEVVKRPFSDSQTKIHPIEDEEKLTELLDQKLIQRLNILIETQRQAFDKIEKALTKLHSNEHMMKRESNAIQELQEEIETLLPQISLYHSAVNRTFKADI